MIPLARLFAMGLRTLTEELRERLEERGFREVRPAHAFVLLACRERPLTGGDVASLLGVTKQAASKLVDAMEAEQLLARHDDPDDARSKRLVIAPRGRRLLETAEAIYRELEADWAAVLGAKRLEALRSDLEHVLRETHGGELPPIKPTW